MPRRRVKGQAGCHVPLDEGVELLDDLLRQRVLLAGRREDGPERAGEKEREGGKRESEECSRLRSKRRKTRGRGGRERAKKKTQKKTLSPFLSFCSLGRVPDGRVGDRRVLLHDLAGEREALGELEVCREERKRGFEEVGEEKAGWVVVKRKAVFEGGRRRGARSGGQRLPLARALSLSLSLCSFFRRF